MAIGTNYSTNLNGIGANYGGYGLNQAYGTGVVNQVAPVGSTPSDFAGLSDEAQESATGGFNPSALLAAFGMDPKQIQILELETEIAATQGQIQQLQSTNTSGNSAQNAAQLQQLQAQLQQLQQELAQLTGSNQNDAGLGDASGADSGSSPASSGGGYGGGGGGSVGSSGGGGGGTGSVGGGGSDNSNLPASTDLSGIDATGQGAKAVEIAASKLGQQSSNVKMDNYTAAGGLDNDCADFVSGVIANAGLYKKQSGDASVATFKQHLIQQGYGTVDKAHAMPGDVAIFNGSQHTELVASKGATTLIGSNNGGTNVQHISKDSGNWGSVVYLHKDMSKPAA